MAYYTNSSMGRATTNSNPTHESLLVRPFGYFLCAGAFARPPRCQEWLTELAAGGMTDSQGSPYYRALGVVYQLDLHEGGGGFLSAYWIF